MRFTGLRAVGATRCHRFTTRGAHTGKVLVQTYRRDTGEVMHDLSVPIHLKGRHWGGFRMGYKAND